MARCLTLFRDRAKRWIEGGFAFGSDAEIASQFRLNIERLCGLVPPNVAFSVLRFFCNGFPTSRRFQDVVKECDFCGLPDSDSAEHFLGCSGIALFRASVFEYGCVPWDLLHILPSTDKELIGGAVLLDCILFALRARRIDAHGAHATMILHARYKHLRVRHRVLEEGLKAVMMM
jgi:hypothetical protein